MLILVFFFCSAPVSCFSAELHLQFWFCCSILSLSLCIQFIFINFVYFFLIYSCGWKYVEYPSWWLLCIGWLACIIRCRLYLVHREGQQQKSRNPQLITIFRTTSRFGDRFVLAGPAFILPAHINLMKFKCKHTSKDKTIYILLYPPIRHFDPPFCLSNQKGIKTKKKCERVVLGGPHIQTLQNHIQTESLLRHYICYTYPGCVGPPIKEKGLPIHLWSLSLVRMRGCAWLLEHVPHAQAYLDATYLSLHNILSTASSSLSLSPTYYCCNYAFLSHRCDAHCPIHCHGGHLSLIRLHFMGPTIFI